MAKAEFFNLTGIVGRIAFHNLFTKKQYDSVKGFIESENGKYGLTLLVAKESKSGKKIVETLKELEEKTKQKLPIGGNARLTSVIKDGDDEEQFSTYYDSFKGNFVITFKSKKPISIFSEEGFKVRKDDTAIIEEEFYNGAVVGVNGSIYYIDNPKGVYANVSAVKFLKHAEPFGDERNSTAEAIKVDEDDLEFYDDYQIEVDDFEDE
jgi:hypothetical protein